MYSRPICRPKRALDNDTNPRRDPWPINMHKPVNKVQRPNLHVITPILIYTGFSNLNHHTYLTLSNCEGNI